MEVVVYKKKKEGLITCDSESRQQSNRIMVKEQRWLMKCFKR